MRYFNINKRGDHLRMPGWLHPEQAVLLWSAALRLVFAPLAVHLYRRKSLG